MSETGLPSNRPQETALFSAVLRPHRSLSRGGFVLLMSVIGVVSFVAGMAFLAIGAWPVLGFFGLDVLLVWLAFHLNYRAARAFETIEIYERELVVTQIAASGRALHHGFNPYWARVSLATLPDGRTDLRLSSHGRVLSFGRFLTDDERREFADALDVALVQARRVGGAQ